MAFFVLHIFDKTFIKWIFSKNYLQKKKKETLDSGLKKSKDSFFNKISKVIVGKSKVDDEVLDNLEEVLISSDVGVKTTLKIIDHIEDRVKKDKFIKFSDNTPYWTCISYKS